MPGLKEMLMGSSAKTEKMDNLSPEQNALLTQMLGGMGSPMQSGMGGLGGILGGDQASLDAFQAPAIRQFQEQIVPGLAEQFAGAGALDSSAFGSAIGGAGAKLSEDLSAQKAGLQSGAMGQLMQMLGLGLGTSPFSYMQTPGTQGAFGAAAGGFGKGIGASLGGGTGFFGKS